MKKQKFLLGAAGLLALGLTACSNEMPVNNDVAQKDETRYMRVAISSPSDGTRAEEFQVGTDAENDVQNMYFKFFDRQGNPVYTAESKDIEFVESTGPNVGKVKEAVVKVELINGEGLPAYVLCFINPFDWTSISDETRKLEAFRSDTRLTYKNSGGKFAMNNAVYFGKDEVTGAENVKISGTPITYNKLFTTEADAKNAKDEEIVNIYVERYAAKVQFSINENAISAQEIGGYTLTFEPQAWTVNADAPNMYVIKRYDNSNDENRDIPTIQEVDEMLQGWTSWNSPTNHRSYWACSPGYYAEMFPEVSDQIADAASANPTTGFSGTGAGQVILVNNRVPATAPNALKYYSYNQVMGNESSTNTGYGIKSFAATAGGVLPCKYVLENTMSANAFASKNPKAAAPSVLVVGRYNIEGIAENTEFFIKEDKIYFSEASVPGADNGDLTMMSYFLDNNQILYTYNENPAEGEDEYVLVNSKSDADILAAFTIEHPKKAVRGDAILAHRYVTLQLEDAPTGLYYSPNGTNDHIPVTASNLDQVNSLLWNQLRTAEHFNAGKCYYSIPIRHLGWSERTGEKPEAEDGEILWDKVLVGDFGLVRNHVYNLNVTEISSQATGIDDLNYPIVPPADINTYWIKYKLNILNWRIVNPQAVTLK